MGFNQLGDNFQSLLNPTEGKLVFQYATPGFKNETPDAAIRHQEVISAVMEVKDGKACGPNGIPTQFYKYGTAELINHMTTIYNNFMETGMIPLDSRFIRGKLGRGV